MYARDIRDIIGGLVLVALGLSAAFYSGQSYGLGTLRSMGPGMFPLGIGVLLAFFGATIAIGAVFRPGPKVEFDLSGAFFVLAGVASFALLVRHLGLVPAIVATVVISSMAAPRFKPVSVAVLSVFLCVGAWLIFRVGLGLPLPIFRFPV